jgi:hypothetical protein
VTLPVLASLAIPAGSGAIGAACETPDTATKANAAIAAANMNRLMLFSFDETMSPSKQFAGMMAVPPRESFHTMNEQSAFV